MNEPMPHLGRKPQNTWQADYAYHQAQLIVVEAEVRSMAADLQGVAEALLGAPFAVRIANICGRSEEHSPGCRAIDARTIPTAAAVQELLDRRNAAVEAAWEAWNRLPGVERRGLQPPVA